MSIVDNIKRMFRKKDEKEIVKQLAASYQEKKENGEENPIDTTISQIMDIIKQSPNPDETAQKILTAAIDANNMPNRIPEKLSILISQSDKISDMVIAKAVEQSDSNVPDEMIERIIKDGDIEQYQRLQLIKNFDDEDIIHKRIKNEFAELYKACKEKRDIEVVTRIQEIKQTVEESNADMNVQDLVEQVVAKKMAENCYSDIKKGTKIYTLAQAYPVNKMFEKDIASRVEEEYRTIEANEGQKPDRFDKAQLRMQILREIARNVGYKYKQSKVFIVPQSENMKRISPEEEEMFINTVESASLKQLTPEDIKEIREEIRGIIRNKETKEAMFLDAIKNMPNRDKNIDAITSILEDEEKLKTLTMIHSSGLLEELTTIPTETRRKAVSAINNTVIERKAQILSSTVKNEEKEQITEQETEKVQDTEEPKQDSIEEDNNTDKKPNNGWER